jgi:actin-like protein 6A
MIQVSDWDVVEQLLNHAFYDRLRLEPNEHPILVAEPAFNTRSLREKMVELIFEKYQAPAIFLAKNPVLSSYDHHFHFF